MKENQTETTIVIERPSYYKAHQRKAHTTTTKRDRVILSSEERNTKGKGKELDISTERIAKWLTNNLCLDRAENATEKFSYIKTELDKLDKHQKRIFCIAYVFSHRVPRQESEDMFQELSLALLESKHTKESCLYITAKHVWALWFKRWYLRQEAEVSTDFDFAEEVALKVGINEIALEDLKEVSPELAEVVDKVSEEVALRYENRQSLEEFDSYQDYAKVSGNSKAEKILAKLPERIKAIGQKKLDGVTLSGAERKALCVWLQRNRNLIASPA